MANTNRCIIQQKANKQKKGVKKLSSKKKQNRMEKKNAFEAAVKQRNQIPASANLTCKQVQDILLANGMLRVTCTENSVRKCFGDKSSTSKRPPTAKMYEAMCRALGDKGELRLHSTRLQRAEAKAANTALKEKVNELMASKGGNSETSDAPANTQLQLVDVTGHLTPVPHRKKEYSHALAAHMALILSECDSNGELPEQVVEDECFRIFNIPFGSKLMKIDPSEFSVEDIIEQSSKLINLFKE